MEKISGIILTKNNQRTIFKCLQSIRDLVQELIIIDDYSDDNTLTIVKEVFPEAKIIKRLLDRFDEQRNFGIKQAAYDWILMIDSDEIVTPELANSIKNIQAKSHIDAYWVVRLNQIFDKYIPENHIHRPILFKKELRFSYPVHEIIKIDKNKKKKLKGALEHENWVSMSETIRKTAKYSQFLCQKWLDEKRNYNQIKIFFLYLALPIYSFFNCWIIKKYYRLGLTKGVAYSIFEAKSWINVLWLYRKARNKN